MFYRIEDRMAWEFKLNCYELLIYGVIYSSQNQTYIRGQNHIAEITWMSLISVKRYTKTLIEKGLIEKVSKGYQIVSERYLEVSERYLEKNEESIWQIPESIWEIPQKYLTDTHTINNKYTENFIEEIKEEKKVDTPKEDPKEKPKEESNGNPTVSMLVKSYEENELLVWKIQDTWVIRQRAEYKQRKKDRAYKSIKWFIQQLAVMVRIVENNLPRTDVAWRLQFAINQAEENEWKWIVWNEKIELDYQSFKKFNSMQWTNKQQHE